MPVPSRGFALLERLGLLAVVLPELAALRGIAQGKALAGDALDHSLRTVDALPAADPILRLAGLLHDVGKAPTAADGHFIGHESEGAVLVEARMRDLAFSRADVERVRHLVRHHLIQYGPEWTDAAVRRFIKRIGPGQPLADVLALRRADTAASAGPEVGDAPADELERRIAALRPGAVLSVRGLAVNGEDLMRELGLAPGPPGRPAARRPAPGGPGRPIGQRAGRAAVPRPGPPRREQGLTTLAGGAPTHHRAGCPYRNALDPLLQSATRTHRRSPSPHECQCPTG